MGGSGDKEREASDNNGSLTLVKERKVCIKRVSDFESSFGQPSESGLT